MGPDHPAVMYLKEDEGSRSLGRLVLAWPIHYVRTFLPEDSEEAAGIKNLEEFYVDPDKYQEYMDMWECMDNYFEREGCSNPLNRPGR